MKGVVFTELLEMVENTFGEQVADRIIDECDLPSGGSYTSIGTYDHNEILTLVTKLSEITTIAVPDLVQAFGKYLFGRFRDGYPVFFEGVDTAFQFLKNIESYIHVEVRKLYPDAELPSFEYSSPSPDVLIMTYSSTRPFGALAKGLVEGCIAHYQEHIDSKIEDLSQGQSKQLRFTLTKQG
jgi:hypothetical protein